MAGLRETWGVWARPLVLQISALVLATVCAAHPASAQTPQQNALARSLFEEGVTLADQSDWVGAADRFGRAYSLKPTSGIAFNWASVLIEAGKLLHAQDLLLSVLRDVAADTQLKSDTQKLLAALTPRIAKLRVHVTGSVDEHTTLEVDGLGWARAAWDIASPIDPGPHSVVLKSGLAESAHTDVTLAEGELREVSLAVRAPQVQPLALAQPITAPVDAPKQPLYKNWIVWTSVGAVVVAGAVTAVVLSTHKSSKDESPVMGNASPGVLRW